MKLHAVPPRVPFYIYRIPPIDYWCGWQRIDRFVRRCRLTGSDYDGHDAEEWNERIGIDAIIFAMEVAAVAARHGWEGDVRGSNVYVTAGLPGVDECGSELVLAFKQDNNGCTFLASKVPIVHLDTDHARIYPPLAGGSGVSHA